MGRILISFDPLFSPGEHFDFLGRKAAEVLADLFPGVQVILRYRKGQAVSSIRPSSMSEQGPSPAQLRTRFMSVPDDKLWRREISLIMGEAVRHFLGFGSEGSFNSNKVLPPSVRKGRKVQQISPQWDLPHELVQAVAICEYVLEAWTKHIGRDLHPEIRMSLSVEFPRWIISHITAALHYSSGAASFDKHRHDVLAKTVAEVHRYLESLVSYRVEGKELSHGVLIAPPPKAARSWKIGTYPDDFQTLKRTALLTDGMRAALWISPSGEPVGWFTAESLREANLCAHSASESLSSLDFLAGASESLHGLSLVLRKNGSIAIFVKGHPLFIWRSGKWRGILWNSLRKVIDKKYSEIGAIIFDAAVILSTTGQSGVFGLVESVPDGIHDKDRVDVARKMLAKSTCKRQRRMPGISSLAASGKTCDTYPEWLFHALLHSDEVISLGPSMLAMLASIDGATIINRKGRLLAYGAIISSRPSGSEGARTAAALELSNKGFVIKVSADGPIALYEGGREIVEV